MSTSDAQKLNEGPVETTPAIVLPQPGHTAASSAPITDVVVTPTQVRRPWRSTTRTIFQALVALATLLPLVLAGVYDSESDYPAIVVQVLAAAAAVTRVMALPQVEEFLRRFLPFLAAAPSPVDERRNQRGAVDLWLILNVALGILTAVVAIEIFQLLTDGRH